MKSTWKPTTARGHSYRLNSSISHQMAHISQKLVNIIHLVAVSQDRAYWRILVMQLEQLTGGVTLLTNLPPPPPRDQQHVCT